MNASSAMYEGTYNGILSGEQFNSGMPDSTIRYGITSATQDANGVWTPTSTSDRLNFSFKLNTPVSKFDLWGYGGSGENGFPAVMAIYGGNTRTEAENKTNLMQIIDITNIPLADIQARGSDSMRVFQSDGAGAWTLYY